MLTRSGGQVLVEALVSEGVDTIFGIPGSHSLPIYDAILDNPSIRHILVRHEQGAAFMADGYARSTGKVGVCLTTTGPPALNAFAALATAYADSCPVLFLCTQIPTDYLDQDRGLYHEVPDQLGLLKRLTGFSARATTVQGIVDCLLEAMQRAQSGRPRPVALEIPADVLHSHGDAIFRTSLRPSPPLGDLGRIDRAVSLIAESSRPVIWAGGGVISSGAHPELAALAELLQAPVLTTKLGKGAMPADHPLHLGYVCERGPVQDYLHSCDLLLAIGTRFSAMNTKQWTLRLPNPIIHIDVDPDVIGKNYPVELGIVGDASLTVEALISQLVETQSRRPSRTDEVSELKALIRAMWQEEMPAEYELIQGMRSVLPRDTIVAMDPTICSYLAWEMLDIYEPRSYMFPVGGATLGYAYPAALGAKVAHPDRAVIAVCGDGGFQFSCQELGTAVQYGITAVVLVFNDQGYGTVRVLQDRRFGRRSEVDLVNPDFVAMARSFGADGLQVNKPNQLKAALELALENDRPTLIEIPIGLSVPKTVV